MSGGVACVERSGRNLRDPYGSRSRNKVCGSLATSGETRRQGRSETERVVHAGKPIQPVAIKGATRDLPIESNPLAHVQCKREKTGREIMSGKIITRSKLGDYLVFGTVEKKVRSENIDQAKTSREVLKHAHDFISYQDLRMSMAGWFPKGQEPPIMKPPPSMEWTIKN